MAWASSPVVRFIVAKCWWIVTVAVITRAVCYLAMAPKGGVTVGYHVAQIIMRVIVPGLVAVVIAFIALRKHQTKRVVFGVSLAIVLGLTAVLDVPTVLVKSQAVRVARSAGTNLARFEALMVLEYYRVQALDANEVIPDRHNREIPYMAALIATGRALPVPRVSRKESVIRALELCQEAARKGNSGARRVLRESGFSW